MHWLKLILLLIALPCLICVSSQAATVVSGYIGSHKRSFPVREISTVSTYAVAGPADYLAVTEVYPDTSSPVEYAYCIAAQGTGSYERRHKSVGFGPTTYFIRVNRSPIGTIKVTNRGKTPIRIASVRAIARPELEKLAKGDSFRILGTTDAGRDEGGRLVEQIAKGITPLPKYRITTGFSAEIRYANQSAENVRKEIERCADWSRRHSLPAMLGLISWWSGTPLWISDEQGGQFGDIKYQQICYTPDVEQPEDPALRALLGERFSNHYCLSIPNQWSSTAWLTMNSKALNDYRYKRFGEVAAALRDVCKGDSKWIDNFYLENEPRYWDTDCEAGNDKRKPAQMWADFNPFAVSAARKDGVELDPRDGLSETELLWLFRNVGAYNQETVDAANRALKSSGFALPIYTHSLQHRGMFPGGGIGHPASEWAYATGARTGIEGIWSQPSDFARLREWGRWANVNREEADGRHLDEHLWDLRVTYMMGADLYNSYNWDALGEGRFFGYVKEFLDSLPVVTLPAAGVKQIDASSVRIESRSKLQAFTAIRIPAVAQKAVTGTLRCEVIDNHGSLLGMSCRPISLAAGASLPSIDFAEPVELVRRDNAVVKLAVLDSKGKPVPGAIRISLDPDSAVEISLNLVTQRALSLSVIAQASRKSQP